MRRVVVTGLGAVTPIGLNTDDFWDAIKKNTVGIDTITSFDSSEYKAHLAAEVKGFNAADCMDFKASRRMEKFSQYAVAAAFEALKDSGLNIENEDAYGRCFSRFRNWQFISNGKQPQKTSRKGTFKNQPASCSYDDN